MTQHGTVMANNDDSKIAVGLFVDGLQRRLKQAAYALPILRNRFRFER